MLLSFSVTNYRSIKDKVSLSMLPIKSLKELPNNIISINDKTKALRTAVIYGANASGKSNVLNALTGFIKLIQDSSDYKIKENIKLYDPFLLDRSTENAPSVFEMEFLIDKIKYIYKVAITNSSVEEENLYYYPKGQKVRIYERSKSEKINYGTVLKGEKKSIENRLLENQLYLSKAANEKLNLLIDIYNYFYDTSEVYSFFSKLSDVFSPSVIIGSALKESDDLFFKSFNSIINSFDIGIHSIKVIERNNSKQLMGLLPEEANEIIDFSKFDDIIPKLKYDLVTIHKFKTKNNKEVLKEFTLEQESNGTKNLFMFALLLIEHFRKGTFMLIDEFEKSLHPHIVEKLIRLFNDPDINVNNAQLIFSTHATPLLDNELFRRDQIWFTEKDEDGITELYSLSDIDGVRKDIPYDKWYSSGRFGATPIISEPEIKFDNGSKTKK